LDKDGGKSQQENGVERGKTTGGCPNHSGKDKETIKIHGKLVLSHKKEGHRAWGKLVQDIRTSKRTVGVLNVERKWFHREVTKKS